jgi:hypothetical protein
LECHEETEQAQEARAPEQAEAWVEAKVVVAVAEEVLPQAPADTACVRTVGKGCLINRGLPVMKRHALNVALP